MIITDSTGGNIRCNENGVLSAFELLLSFQREREREIVSKKNLWKSAPVAENHVPPGPSLSLPGSCRRGWTGQASHRF